MTMSLPDTNWSKGELAWRSVITGESTTTTTQNQSRRRTELAEIRLDEKPLLPVELAKGTVKTYTTKTETPETTQEKTFKS
tara:strand:+ start:155 stop:397 length:243 start_codon:yes stop_codon:yes gene_type:complete